MVKPRKVEIGGGKFSADTADVALILVAFLCLVLVFVSIAVKDMREMVFTGALPILFGVFTLAVGGVAAYKVYNSPNQPTPPAPPPAP